MRRWWRWEAGEGYGKGVVDGKGGFGDGVLGREEERWLEHLERVALAEHYVRSA